MNTITVHGNLTDEPVLRVLPSGRTLANFKVAVNRRRYDRESGRWEDQAPVFHRVVAFGDLAANLCETLRKGTAVTVTGELADNSYTDQQTGQRRWGVQLLAEDVAVSLRFATAVVTRTQRTSSAARRADTDGLDEATAADDEPVAQALAS